MAFYLAFDILQLSALLFLTGGLTNPFAVLVLGPIAVAAAVLGRDYSFALTFLAILCLAALFASPSPVPTMTIDCRWPSDASRTRHSGSPPR